MTNNIKTWVKEQLRFLKVFLFTEGSRRNLRNDLLVAADSITNTMSSLVKELNSGESLVSTHLCAHHRGTHPRAPLKFLLIVKYKKIF